MDRRPIEYRSSLVKFGLFSPPSPVLKRGFDDSLVIIFLLGGLVHYRIRHFAFSCHGFPSCLSALNTPASGLVSPFSTVTMNEEPQNFGMEVI